MQSNENLSLHLRMRPYDPLFVVRKGTTLLDLVVLTFTVAYCRSYLLEIVTG